MRTHKVTLRDVAKQAGVSVGTVSRYLNNNPSVSQSARDAIAAAVKKLDYTPNLMAQNLAKGKSGNLLLYIYQEFPIFNTTWLFELPIIHGIFDYLKSTNYSIQMAIGSIYNPESFKHDIFRQIDAKLVDGIIILSSWPAESTTLVKLIETKFPYVLLGNANHVNGMNHIVFDNAGVVEGLVSRLVELGHRDIAFFGGYPTQLHTMERFAGFKRGLAKHCLPARDEWVKYGDYSFESGIKFMDEAIADGPPTAVVAGNDFIAAGAIRSIKRHGMRVPEDISVTGFDNLTVASMIEPELTSVKVPLFEMGRRAMERLVGEIRDKSHQFESEMIPTMIVERDSIGQVPAR